MRARQRVLVCSLLVVLAVAAARPAAAEAKFRWKFEEGQQLKYEFQQKMTMEMKLGDRPLEVVVDQKFDMLSTAKSVDDEGIAKIEQQIGRMQMTMKTPDGKEIKIDSAAMDEPDDEVSKAMLPLLKKLVKAKFEFKMAPNGKISDVSIPDDLFDPADKSPTGRMFSQMFTKETLTQMVTQGSPVFPKEIIPIGEKWQQRYSVKNPLVGKQTVDTIFTYLGGDEDSGQKLEKFGIEMMTEFGGDQPEGAPKIEIKKQDTEGAIFFDAAAGRLDHSSINQTIEMQIELGGAKMDQKIKNEIKVKVTPVKE